MPNEFIVKNGLISQGNITISGSITATGGVTVSGSIASASYASNAELLDGLDSTVFTLTSSFNAQTASFTAFTSSMNSFSASILTNVTALNAKTASFATTGSNTFVGAEVISGSLAISGSGTPFTLNTDTLEITGSLLVTGSTTLTGSLLQLGNFTTTGTIIAQTINVQTVTSSIVYSSGSNVFGNSLGNSQTFTGSVLITGSLTIAGASSATSYSGTTIYGSTVACSPIGCFATSCATSFIGGTMSGTCIIVSSKIIVGGTSGDIGADLLRVKGTIITDNNAGYLGYSSAGNRFDLAKISSGDEIVLGASNSPGAVALISGTGQDLILRSNGTCERIRITSCGNVGIGTNSPNFKTHISTGDAASITQPTAGTYGLYVQQNTSGNVGGLYIQDGASNSGNSIFVGDNNGAARFVVNTDGNVGIGTSSPTTFLHVLGSNTSARGQLSIQSNNGSNAAKATWYYDTFNGGEIGTTSTDFYGLATNNFLFYAGGSERMRITSGGQVGIGGTPSSWDTANVKVLQLKGTALWTFGDGVASFMSTNTYYDGAVRRYIYADYAIEYDQNAGSHIWYSNPVGTAGASFTPTERMRISSVGKIGIGAISPNWLLEICCNTTATGGGGYPAISINNPNDAGYSAYYFHKGSTNFGGMELSNATCHLFVNSLCTFAIQTTGVERMRISFTGTSTFTTTENQGGVYVTSATDNTTIRLASSLSGGQEWRLQTTGGDSGLGQGKLIFKVGGTETASYIPLTLTTDNSTNGGRVGIGTLSPSYQLQLSADSAAKPSTNTWTISSDIRVKENINPYTKGLETILKINPVTYDYNGKAGFDKIKDNIGIIAQDVLDILPESISTYMVKLNDNDDEESELYNLNSHALTYILINAIKEQQCTICSQASMINTLKTCLGIS